VVADRGTATRGRHEFMRCRSTLRLLTWKTPLKLNPASLFNKSITWGKIGYFCILIVLPLRLLMSLEHCASPTSDVPEAFRVDQNPTCCYLYPFFLEVACLSLLFVFPCEEESADPRITRRFLSWFDIVRRSFAAVWSFPTVGIIFVLMHCAGPDTRTMAH